MCLTVRKFTWCFLLCVLCSLTQLVFAKKVELINPTTARIRLHINRDNKHSDLIINLASRDDLVNWGIGFWMMQVFVDPSKNLNLKMSVCFVKNKAKQCEPLKILIAPKLVNNHPVPPLSYGHITIFVPQSKIRMREFDNYTISISHINEVPQNITALPQKLFLYDVDTKITSPVVVTSYKIEGFKRFSKKILHTDIQANATSEELNHFSIDPLKAKLMNNISPIVPLPAQVSYMSDMPPLSIWGKIKLTNQAGIKNDFIMQCLEALPKLLVGDATESNNHSSMFKISLFSCHNLPDWLGAGDDCGTIKDRPEGYILQIRQGGINILANTNAGYFYAYQSLRQLFFAANNNRGSIALQTIVDYPRFKYRGMMLDSVRHFFTVTEVEKFIDIMASQKLNTLHFHLADDEGWRLELPSKQFKPLVLVGAKRGLGLIIGPSNLVDNHYDITDYSHHEYASASDIYAGYYSIAEIKQIIDYANLRQITVIPEIELPGHASALKRSLPNEFYDTTDHSSYYSVQGYNDNVIPVCDYLYNHTFTKSLNQLITEVADEFNGQSTLYANKLEVSLSGDEVPKGAFKQLPSCRIGIWKQLATIGHQGISQMLFKQIGYMLPRLKLSGWQQMVQNDNASINPQLSIAKGQVGHIWEWEPTVNKPATGYSLADSLLNNGYHTVLDFADLSYFDIRYNDTNYLEPGLYWSTNYLNTYSTLSNSWLISSNSLDSSFISDLDGIEGALWSELIPSYDHLMYMTEPKMSGIAEAAWSNPQAVSWDSLNTRLGNNNYGFLLFLSWEYKIRLR